LAHSSSFVVGLSAGDEYTCALLSAGGVICWGANDYGQLGAGSTAAIVHASAASQVALGTNVLAAELNARGHHHACVRTLDGRIKCWGGNYWGELGVGDQSHRGTSATHMGDALPYVDLGDGARALQLASGGFHTCALLEPRSNGGKHRAKCWGANEWGQLGYGDTAARGQTASSMGEHLPDVELAPADSDDHPVALSAGKHFTCALLEPSGGVKCWGGNVYAQLGIGSSGEEVGAHPGEMGAQLRSVANIEPSDLIASSATGYFSCARPLHATSKNGGPAFRDGGQSGSRLLRCWPAPDGLPPHGGDVYEKPERSMEGNYGEKHRPFKHHGPEETLLLGKLPPTPALAISTSAEGVKGSAAEARVSMLALSTGSVCAVLEPSGELHCYGNNQQGQLGRGDTVDGPLPPLGECEPLDLATSCAALAEHDTMAVALKKADTSLPTRPALRDGAGSWRAYAAGVATLVLAAAGLVRAGASGRAGRLRQRAREQGADAVMPDLL